MEAFGAGFAEEYSAMVDAQLRVIDFDLLTLSNYCINLETLQLSAIGGTSVRECTNRSLRYVMTNATATHFN